ncbi:MAG: hypothetical protein AUG80_09000 [Candidatus Rokubacteria bacterium 13_1_20CM_4_68_9]|nr:MAG: hypothetical protein AUG80_09000 [Candidatus Rokubacteria bacterium 13_1_20CM_4_68_9]
MQANTRRIVITLLSCAVIQLLLALAGPEAARAQQTFSIAFPKKAGEPNSCMTQMPGGNGGTFLRCRIVLPADVPSDLFIRAVFFECRPGSSQACLNTQQCPGNGAICDRHVNPVVPVDFNISQPGARAVEWWGWTSDVGDATLHFDVTVGP